MAKNESTIPHLNKKAGTPPWLRDRRKEKIDIRSDGHSIRNMFRLAISVVCTLAFFVIFIISFVRVTGDELTRASNSIKSEVNYLCLQLESLAMRAEAYDRTAITLGATPEKLSAVNPQDLALLSDPVGDILSGYTLAETGTVVIAQDGIVIASDDERIPVSGDLRDLLGNDAYAAVDASIADGQLHRIPLGSALATPSDKEGYLLAGLQGDYTIVIVEPESMVFRDRITTLGRETTITAVVLIVAFLVADRLLIILVARRIDRTIEVLQQVVDGDLDARVEPEGSSEFRSLARGINVTVDALKGLIEESERRMEQDLATARMIQEGSLPRNFPSSSRTGGIDLYASMDPAREVGGDFYDFFPLDEHTLAFLIADVSGKGIPASLFMMAAKNEIKNRLLAGLSLSDAISAANASLCAENEARMFVTVWAATLDHDTGLLTYVNAGHNFPLLRRDGEWVWLKKKCGLFLGAFDTAKYTQEALILESGDELLLYTDGVNEAFSIKDEQYGNDRLEGFLSRHTDLSPKELVPALRADVAAWAEGAEQSDDVTIMAVEVCAQS